MMAKAERRMITWPEYRRACTFGEGCAHGACYMNADITKCRRETCTEWSKLPIEDVGKKE